MIFQDKSKRLKKRISICEAIYANLIIGEKCTNSTLAKFDNNDWTRFEHRIYKQYLKQKEYFIESIKKLLSVNWSLERLNLIILAIILEAVVEYEVFKTEPAILIHQSLQISREYGESEHKLVHAIIDNYFKTKLKEKDKI